MPEILTESFCERCGTRYTFQSSAPKVGRMAKMKVLSRGLKNYVLSDETSLDEAFAEARSTDDRQHSVEQLDAFHKTFNFCMSCRQYTCANCWNEAEGRCLSCAPSLGPGAGAAFPNLNPVAGIAGAIGSLNGNGNGLNGHAEPAAASAAWPTTDLTADQTPGAPSVSRLEALFGRTAPEPVAKAETAEGEDAGTVAEGVASEVTAEDVASEDAPHKPELIGLEGIADEVDAEGEVDLPDAVAAVVDTADDIGDDADVAAAFAASVEAAGVDGLEPAVAAAAETVTGDAPADHVVPAAAHELAHDEDLLPVDAETDDLAAAAVAQTHDLLDRFRATPVVIPAPTQAARPIGAPPRPPIAPPTPAPQALPYAATAGQGMPAAAAPGTFVPPSAPAYGAPAAPTYGGPQAQPYPAVAQQPYGPPAYGGPAQPYASAQAGAPQPQYPPAMPYAVAPPPYQEPSYSSYPPAQPPYEAPAPAQPQYAAPAQPRYLAPAPAQPPYAAPAPVPPQPYQGPPVQPQYPAPAPAPAPRPSWRMVAPESPVQSQPSNGHGYEGPPPEPEWPTTPSWPAPVARTSRTRGAEAVWAESTRDLLTKTETGVSACFNCGLPLSATARFCRRCGTSQVSS